MFDSSNERARQSAQTLILIFGIWKILFFLEKDIKENFINIGTGSDISIKELADLIKDKINYKGEILWDSDKPDGMLKKCLDISKMKNYGFFPKISLDQGVDNVINSYNNKFQNI